MTPVAVPLSHVPRFGGFDKSSNGHRYDSVIIANGMIDAGMSCQGLSSGTPDIGRGHDTVTPCFVFNGPLIPLTAADGGRPWPDVRRSVLHQIEVRRSDAGGMHTVASGK